MKWNHNETRITDGKILHRPGTMVEVDLKTFIPMKATKNARKPIIDINEYDFDAQRIYGSSAVAMVLNLDATETFYLVLIKNRKYFVQTKAVALLE